MEVRDDMPIVIVESPYAGEVLANVRYARACMADCLKRGEAPYASHLLYTQQDVLDDDVPEERVLGIAAGFSFRKFADRTVVYYDRGISKGMKYGIDHSRKWHIPIEFRSLEGKRRAYLAGPMEYTHDNGLGWRLQYRELLSSLNIQCIIPSEEEAWLKETLQPGENMNDLKYSNPSKHNLIIRQFIEQDLKLVEETDMTIVQWSGERMSGTIGEVQHAYLNGKTAYLVTKRPIQEVPGWFLACFTKVFTNVNELVSHLKGE